MRHVTDDNNVLHDWVQTIWLSQCGPQSMRRSVLVLDSSNPMADPRVHRILVDKGTQILEAPGLFDTVCSSFLSTLTAIYTDWIVGDGLWRPRQTATRLHIVDWIALSWLSVQRTVVEHAFAGYNEKLGLRLAGNAGNPVKANTVQLSSKVSPNVVCSSKADNVPRRRHVLRKQEIAM